MWTKCPVKIFSQSKIHHVLYERSLKSHRSSNEWENTNKQNNNNNKTLHREWKSQLPPSLDQIISWSCWLHWLILIPQEQETSWIIFRWKLEVLGTNDFQLVLSVVTIGKTAFNPHRMSTKKKEGRKKPCKVGSKISMKTTTYHMHFHPSLNLTILKVFPKSFPIEMKPS